MVEEPNEYQPQCKSCGSYNNKLLMVTEYSTKTKISFQCDGCGQINFLVLQDVANRNGNEKKEISYTQ